MFERSPTLVVKAPSLGLEAKGLPEPQIAYLFSGPVRRNQKKEPAKLGLKGA